MDLATLPRTQATSKVYKHVIIDAHSAKESATHKKMEFFYIGNDSFKINTLVKIFESGYASDSVENAISILKRFSPSQPPADIFIIDARISESSLREFNKYVSAHLNFAAVPLVIEASDLFETELKKFRKYDFLDEILFIKEISGEKLIAKVDFLKKIKKIDNQQALKRNIQTSVSGVEGPSWVLKRLFDILISALAIIILSPVFLLIALAIVLESKGPVFYNAKRAGKGYRIFTFYKFRTMIIDADKKVDQLSHLNQYNGTEVTGPVFFKISNDPRITKVGTFLRNTSLDELPQLFNVLFGDMSLVGNRPLPLYEAATLTTDDWAARFMAPAGITGLWQIKKRGDKNMSAEERINLDIAYAKQYNFIYDLWIIANTPSALLQKENV